MDKNSVIDYTFVYICQRQKQFLSVTICFSLLVKILTTITPFLNGTHVAESLTATYTLVNMSMQRVLYIKGGGEERIIAIDKERMEWQIAVRKFALCLLGTVVPQPTLAPPISCTSCSDPRVLQKLEQLVQGLDQVKSKLDQLAAKVGKCGPGSHG